jgi:hypothetical protein
MAGESGGKGDKVKEALIIEKAMEMAIESWLRCSLGQEMVLDSTVKNVKEHFIKKATIEMEKVK